MCQSPPCLLGALSLTPNPGLDAPEKGMARCTQMSGATGLTRQCLHDCHHKEAGLESGSPQPHSPSLLREHVELGGTSLRELDGSLGVSMATGEPPLPSSKMVYLSQPHSLASPLLGWHQR